jgi:Dehydrogenases with different specificities (related to short-chain alcohol dehydrogenases)
MLLKDKIAVVYGGGGAVGSALAEAFARNGARVVLAGRRAEPLVTVAAQIRDVGGIAEVAPVDVMDQEALTRHAAGIDARHGGIDIVANAIGIPHLQGVPLADLTLEEFERPLHGYMRALFAIAKATAPALGRRRGSVILTLSTPGSKVTHPGFLGYGTTCAAIEAFSRMLAGELGGQGTRVVCIRPDAMPDTLATSHVGDIFRDMAARFDADLSDMLSSRETTGTFIGRFPRVKEVADYAAFIASDRAAAVTGQTLTITGGSTLD